MPPGNDSRIQRVVKPSCFPVLITDSIPEMGWSVSCLGKSKKAAQKILSYEDPRVLTGLPSLPHPLNRPPPGACVERGASNTLPDPEKVRSSDFSAAAARRTTPSGGRRRQMHGSIRSSLSYTPNSTSSTFYFALIPPKAAKQPFLCRISTEANPTCHNKSIWNRRGRGVSSFSM